MLSPSGPQRPHILAARERGLLRGGRRGSQNGGRCHNLWREQQGMGPTAWSGQGQPSKLTHRPDRPCMLTSRSPLRAGIRAGSEDGRNAVSSGECLQQAAREARARARGRSQATLQLEAQPQLSGASSHSWAPPWITGPTSHPCQRRKREGPRRAQELALRLAILWEPTGQGEGKGTVAELRGPGGQRDRAAGPGLWSSAPCSSPGPQPRLP